MSQPVTTINYLQSWHDAEARDAATSPFYADDGRVHLTHLKAIGDSGKQYLAAIQRPRKSSPQQELGTAVHSLVLGERPGKPVVCYPGKTRAGKAWEAFEAEHAGATILNASEWARAQDIAASVLADDVAREFMAGARFEVPLQWDDGGVPCATSGVDIVAPNRVGDLKTANSTHIEKLQRASFGYSYHCQLAWMRRGAVANGLDVSGGLFVVAVETVPPYETVVLEMSEGLIDLAERTVSLWLERFRVYRESNQWPGRAQSAVVWPVPSWMRDDDEEEGDS